MKDHEIEGIAKSMSDEQLQLLFSASFGGEDIREIVYQEYKARGLEENSKRKSS